MTTSTLYRSAAVAGLITGVLLLFNDGRRVGLIPENDLTTAVAPIPAAFALFAVVGLYLAQRTEGGRPAAAGFVGLLTGVAGLLVVEFSTHYIFFGLDAATRAELVTPRVRAGFLVIAAVFALGTVLFAIGSWRGGRYPRWAIGLFAVGFVLTATRGFTPEWVVSVGFVVGPVGLIGLSAALWRRFAEVRGRVEVAG